MLLLLAFLSYRVVFICVDSWRDSTPSEHDFCGYMSMVVTPVPSLPLSFRISSYLLERQSVRDRPCVIHSSHGRSGQAEARAQNSAFPCCDLLLPSRVSEQGARWEALPPSNLSSDKECQLEWWPNPLCHNAGLIHSTLLFEEQTPAQKCRYSGFWF